MYELMIFLAPWVAWAYLSQVVPWDRSRFAKALFAVAAVGIVLYQLDRYLGI